MVTWLDHLWTYIYFSGQNFDGQNWNFWISDGNFVRRICLKVNPLLTFSAVTAFRQDIVSSRFVENIAGRKFLLSLFFIKVFCITAVLHLVMITWSEYEFIRWPHLLGILLWSSGPLNRRSFLCSSLCLSRPFEKYAVFSRSGRAPRYNLSRPFMHERHMKFP